MASFRRVRVSSSWAVTLTAAALDGVAFELESGRRIIAEQQTLRARYERFLRGGPWAPVAAKPSCAAPHIDCGHESHALDVRWTDGGVYRLAAWLRKQGCRVAWTVPGEKWHIEVPEEDLLRLARRLRDPLRGFRADEKRWIREYDELKRRKPRAARREELRALMRRRRKEVWRAAQKTGWKKINRRARYEALLARSR